MVVFVLQPGGCRKGINLCSESVQIEQDTIAEHLPSCFTDGTSVLEEVIRLNSLPPPFNKKLLVLTCKSEGLRRLFARMGSLEETGRDSGSEEKKRGAFEQEPGFHEQRNFAAARLNVCRNQGFIFSGSIFIYI